MQPVELYPGVISDSNILGGKPVIKGTRVPVSLVLGKLAGGMSIEEVIYEYYLDMAGIRAALGSTHLMMHIEKLNWQENGML